MSEREYRNFAEIRSSESESEAEYRVEGYASTFEPYEMCEIEGEKYFERIEPTAFDECDMSDVVLRVDHAGAVYARTSAGTLIVGKDDHGLHTEADLSRTANSRALYDEIKAGNYPQMSFCFVVPEGGDRFDKDSRTRVIERISKLYDVSPVSFPANPTTELHARALEYFNGEIEKLKAERPEEETDLNPVVEERTEDEEGKAEAAEIIMETEEREAEIETAEVSAEDVEDRKAEEFAEYRALQLQVINGEVGTVVESHREENEMEEKRYTPDTPEYRDAFWAMMFGRATEEQRAIFADNTNFGDGLALPVTTDQAIWDQILSEHPVLNDIAIVRSGVVMKVTQMTPNLTSAGKAKKDSAAVVELTFTSNEKVLAGKDYVTYVTLSYAEAKMSQGAMEAFLVKEVADVLGEQLAKDVFASIESDAAANSTTKGDFYYSTIGEALGKATQAKNPVIYAPADKYYEILMETDTGGQPIVRDGVVLNAVLKKDNAATHVTIFDPAMYVLNVVQDTQIKTQDDVKTATYVIGGYLRAEGCLRKTNAAAFIA